MKRTRYAWALALALTAVSPAVSLETPVAHAQDDDDWSVTRTPGRPTRPSRPTRPARPNGPARPVGPARPARPARPTNPAVATPVGTPPPSTDPTPPSADPERARRDRMIRALSESVLRSALDDSAPMSVLLRLVRERDGSIDALVSDFERRSREAPDAPNPRLALGHLYREAGRLDDALREYAAAERAPAAAAAAARAQGALLRRMDRGADARAAYERSLARAGTDRTAQSDTLRALIELSLDAHDAANARAFHQRLVALDRQSNTVRRELADALLQRRMYAEAVAEFQSLARAMAGDNRVLPPVLRDLGRAYAGNNQHDEALASYRRALALAGADAGVRRELYDAITEVYTARNALPAWIAELERMNRGDAYERSVLLGRLHEQAGNASAAVTAYRRAISARPNDLDAYVHVAQLYHQQGQRDEEIAAYRRLTAIAPREPDFVAKLADLLIEQGHRDEAMRVLSQASARAGGDPNVHERLAEVYARHERQQDALREIELVARLDPNSPAALTALGRQYFELGQRDRALATWRRIYDTARDRARGAVALAEVYQDSAFPNEAIEMYREAVRLRPEVVDYHRGLATALERTRQFAAAVESWRRVIELSQRDRDLRRVARESIVRIWGIQGVLDQQIPRLEAAFNATPPDVEAGRDLAESFVRRRRSEDAERVLRRVVELDPADVASLVSLERTLAQRGDLAGSLDVLRRLTEADPRRAREWYQRMGQHALALHRDEEAIAFQTRAVQLNDQDATAHLHLAELYRARGDMGHAIASLRRALELNDRLFPTYFELADLYLGVRDEPREAVALYRRVVQLTSNDDDVLRAGRRAVQIAPAAGVSADLERDLAAASAAQPTRAVFRRLLVAWYDAATRPLINRVRQGSPAERTAARRELQNMGARALAPMLDALADPDPAQQRIALDVLGYLGNINASSALLALTERSGDADVRRRSLVAAGALGDPRSLPRLAALQLRHGELAAAATWGIGHIRTPAATAALVRSLGNEYGSEVRVMAALGLAGTRDPAARAALRRALSDEGQAGGQPQVRAAAVYALGGGDRSATPLLLAALDTTSFDLRKAAAAALGAGGSPAEAAPALARALFSHDAALRRSAAAALARLAGAEPVVQPPTSPRAVPARAARNAQPDATAPSSEHAFDDPTHALSASSMLTALLDPAAPNADGARALVRHRRVITEAAVSALSSVVERAQSVLLALAEPDALAPLAPASSVRSDPEARAARASLVEALVPSLAALLRHQDASLRRSALRVLAQSTTPAATRAMQTALADADETIAATAAEHLGARRDDAAAAEALTARLFEDTRWSVRVSAANALGVAANPRSVEALARALRDDSYEYVRVAAARALQSYARRGDEAARAALARASREDRDSSVRRVAEESL